MSPPQRRRRPRVLVTPRGRESEQTVRDATTTVWTRIDRVTLPIVRAAALRLARAERAIDGAYDEQASARIDKALARLEELLG